MDRSSEIAKASLTQRQAPPPANPTVERLDQVIERLDRLIQLMAQQHPRREPTRTRKTPALARAIEYLTRKLREAGPEGVEWKRLVVEGKFEGGFSDRTLRRARDLVGQARYDDGTCYWILKPGA